ncbi:MAG: ATP-binding protein, partial [Desulfovibrio sp.]|nr:ATP-binding protein [Desulfovibrio sp.]
MAEEAQKHEFRAEVRKVLNILTNSLYTNREIFLRELISNASDALDKLRFRINRGETPAHNDLPLEIRIKLDKDKNILTISDTGLGMTGEELADNLGTIAKSGSENFLQDFENSHTDNKENADTDASNIIGRFGVGFYSVFMVAKQVKVISRPAFGEDQKAHAWISDGLGTYSVEEVESDEPVRGTTIEVRLKNDAEEFAQKYRIDSIIRKHSAFVPFPVFVDDEQANTQPALWREPKSQVTAEQYNSFYRAQTYDSKDPLDVQH